MAVNGLLVALTLISHELVIVDVSFLAFSYLCLGLGTDG